MRRPAPTKFLHLRLAIYNKGFSQLRLCEAYNESEYAITHKYALYQCELSANLTGKRPFRLDVVYFLMRELDLPLDKMSYYFPEDGVDVDD